MRTIPSVLLIVAFTILAGGCQQAYIAAAESMGYQKREMLVDRVQNARDEQTDARKEFTSTLDQLMALSGAQPGELEKVYDRLKKSLSRSEKKARAVRERIGKVDVVANALFSEWTAELDQYSNPSLRRASEQQLDATRTRYDELIGAMRTAESKMDPVLVAFREQVLFLKHQLNARAIASLETSASQLESEVAALIAEMDESIREANAFIDSMRSDSNG